ncbi:hypothetical protein [Opitutus sp. ER46]|uniref:hypothetical protein n=1 Tax=Opitutus sp. ER46 TaxID=2161864 RepID=UPI000D300FEF|nr:hypothetical protein [Opitutus sp. ER46]PTY00090.1 hypothetical protein DB354_02025 [Opitutus sp. ER46]
MPAHPSRIADLLRRLAAAGCAALVLGLAILSACPELHHALHRGDVEAPDHHCAVTLFSTGTAAPAAAVAVAAPSFAVCARVLAPQEDPFVAAPRYLRHPERGPPVSLVA